MANQLVNKAEWVQRASTWGNNKNTWSLRHLGTNSASAFCCTSPQCAGLMRRDLPLETRQTHPVAIRPPGSLSGCGDHREAAHDVSSLWRSTTSSEASERRFDGEGETDRNSGGFTAAGIYSLFQFARGLLIFSSFLYLFILFPNSFLIHLKENKTSSQMHKYCQSE